MDSEQYTLLKMCNLECNSGCILALNYLKEYYPDTQISQHNIGGTLYATFTTNNKNKTYEYTYRANDLLKYIITELSKKHKSIRIPRADADLYQSSTKELGDILQSFLDSNFKEFIPF